MLKRLIAVPALLLAMPAAAQPPQGGPTPPPEFIQAAQAFGTCLGAAAEQIADNVAPEAGATAALAGCVQQRTDLETRFEAWISGPTFPEAGRAIAREQFRSQIAGVPAQIAEGIRRERAGEAAPAAPAND